MVEPETEAVATEGGTRMVEVSCPACGAVILGGEIPARLPIAVPDHTHGDQRCAGSGRPSPQVWMVNPFAGHQSRDGVGPVRTAPSTARPEALGR
jgi:hypothetical protein